MCISFVYTSVGLLGLRRLLSPFGKDNLTMLDTLFADSILNPDTEPNEAVSHCPKPIRHRGSSKASLDIEILIIMVTIVKIQVMVDIRTLIK